MNGEKDEVSAEPRWRTNNAGICFRVLGAVIGGIFMFGLWLMAVLVRMPRPPVPPLFAVSLTVPAVTAVGFALGIGVDKLINILDNAARITHLGRGKNSFLFRVQKSEILLKGLP